MSFINSGNSNLKNNFLFYSLIIGFFSISAVFQANFVKPEIVINKQTSALNIKNLTLKFFSFGNKRIISSILWIETLLESDLEHYKKRDLNNWMYLRFLSISELDPKFYENYLYGGMFLSIVKDDLLGAADIYEKGLIHYPKDYKLNYNAGFNYYYEIGDYEKGLKLLENVSHLPEMPHSVKSIINKIKFETTHNYEIAISFLEFNLTNTTDKIIEEKIKKDLYSLYAERDLECLNKKNKNCNMRDRDGNFYILKDGKWKSVKPFIKYKIFKRN